jgi:hypothetical protein
MCEPNECRLKARPQASTSQQAPELERSDQAVLKAQHLASTVATYRSVKNGKFARTNR